MGISEIVSTLMLYALIQIAHPATGNRSLEMLGNSACATYGFKHAASCAAQWCQGQDVSELLLCNNFKVVGMNDLLP